MLHLTLGLLGSILVDKRPCRERWISQQLPPNSFVSYMGQMNFPLISSLVSSVCSLPFFFTDRTRADPVLRSLRQPHLTAYAVGSSSR
jgi:hypothetical protein